MALKEAGTRGPEIGRFGKVDVTSDAQRRLIIPALRQIMAVDPYAHMDQKEKIMEIAAIAGERIAMPIWGQQLNGLYIPRRATFSNTGAEEVTINNGRFHNSVLLDDVPHLIAPRITDSLIISDNTALGIHGGSNPPKFTSEHMDTMAQLGLKLKEKEIRSEDWNQVERSLEEIQSGLVDEYTN